MIAGTPSGITLAPEGGAHQSTVTPSLGIELPGLHLPSRASPARSSGCCSRRCGGLRDREDGDVATCGCRPSPIDQALIEPALAQRLGEETLRPHALAGGYVLREPAPGADQVALAVCGALVDEALAAAAQLAEEEGIEAWVFNLTSPDRLYREW